MHGSENLGEHSASLKIFCNYVLCFLINCKKKWWYLIEMLVLQDLWRSSDATSCSKQNCHHCWIASTRALPSLENLQRWRFITSLGNLSEGHTALLVGKIFFFFFFNVQPELPSCRLWLLLHVMPSNAVEEHSFNSVIFAAPLQILAGS